MEYFNTEKRLEKKEKQNQLFVTPNIIVLAEEKTNCIKSPAYLHPFSPSLLI